MKDEFPFPRRQAVRSVMRALIGAAFALLADLRIEGQENIPAEGPALLVMNHFSYLDPVLMIRVVSRPMEFMGSPIMPNAPFHVRWLAHLWGVYPVFRGTASRVALRAAEAVLAKGGLLGLAPEGGSWATVLRPPRPGAAFVATRTGAPVIPMGFDGLTELFPMLRKGRRARVTARIGKACGPFNIEGSGRERRERLDAVGHEIMRHIAALIPPERHGYYSADPALREAARGAEIYPWEHSPEL